MVLILAPVSAWLKEWAYAGFAITLGSTLIAHFSVGDGPEAWGWAAATSVLWGLSYFLWRRLQAARASASPRSSFHLRKLQVTLSAAKLGARVWSYT